MELERIPGKCCRVGCYVGGTQGMLLIVEYGVDE